MTKEKLIFEVTVLLYTRKVQTTKTRRATYYNEGDKLPKKYQDGLEKKEYLWMFIKERKGIVLVDSGGDPVIKNSKSVGSPRYKSIKGNDLHTLRMKDYERSKIIKAIKEDFKKATEHLKEIEPVLFPIRLTCEVHHPIVDPETRGQEWDLDNHALWYMKVFPDVLCGCPYKDANGKMAYESKRIIPDDTLKYITQPPVPIFVPVETINDRKLVFRAYTDTRPIIKNNPHYGEFRRVIKLEEVSGIQKHLYAPELNTLVLKSGEEFKVPRIEVIQEALDYLNK